jgi:hypothetical protein
VEEQPGTHELKVRQVRRFRVEPHIGDEAGLRDALRAPAVEHAPAPARRAGLSQGVRTLCTVTSLACGLILNLPTVAAGSQMTWEALQALDTLF